MIKHGVYITSFKSWPSSSYSGAQAPIMIVSMEMLPCLALVQLSVPFLEVEWAAEREDWSWLSPQALSPTVSVGDWFAFLGPLSFSCDPSIDHLWGSGDFIFLNFPQNKIEWNAFLYIFEHPFKAFNEEQGDSLGESDLIQASPLLRRPTVAETR